jgi:hypothetical protein
MKLSSTTRPHGLVYVTCRLAACTPVPASPSLDSPRPPMDRRQSCQSCSSKYLALDRYLGTPHTHSLSCPLCTHSGLARVNPAIKITHSAVVSRADNLTQKHTSCGYMVCLFIRGATITQAAAFASSRQKHKGYTESSSPPRQLQCWSVSHVQRARHRHPVSSIEAGRGGHGRSRRQAVRQPGYVRCCPGHRRSACASEPRASSSWCVR